VILGAPTSLTTSITIPQPIIAATNAVIIIPVSVITSTMAMSIMITIGRGVATEQRRPYGH